MQPQYPGRGPYGPPPQGHYPPPGAPWHAPTPPNNRRARRIAVTVIVAVVLVAAAGGVWLWTRDGGGGGSEGPDTPAARDYEAGVESLGAAEVSWQVEQGVAQGAIGVDDHWVTDEHLVRRLPGRVVAYELRTGKEVWESQLGKISDFRCPSSQQHSNLRVALLVATAESECGKLTVLDIGTGKEVFTADLPPIENEAVAIDVPVVFGEMVVIPGGAGTRVLDINNGAVRSMPNPESACQSRTVALFDDLLLAHAVCDEYDDNATNRLRAFDANLKMVWEWTTPKGADGKPLPVLGVLSLDPLVVELGHFGHETQLMRVDPASGDTVPMNGYNADEYMPACDGWALGDCESATVADNKVIAMTSLVQINPDDPDASPGMQSTEFRNELVAYDLETGEEAWRTGMVDGRVLSLVPATEEDGVVAFQAANPNGSKGIVFSVDPGTGKLAPLLPIGPKAHENEYLFNFVRAFNFGGDNHQAVWREGLLIIFTNTHRAASAGAPDTVAFTLPS